MLVLTRSVYDNKTIVIQTSDGDINISIQEIKGGQVKIGFEAPENVDIWRSEVLDRELIA